MVSRAAGGSWSNPAFYTLGSGSFGLQIGVQNAQMLMLIMTNGGLNAILNSQFKFGADAGLTIATLGAGVNGSMSTAINADILTLSKTEGLYGGISLAGSVIANDSNSEQSYYGTTLDARAIVVGMQGSNPGANPLRATLSQYGG
jgi:lipid-binding SYLF domain-containing protein